MLFEETIAVYCETHTTHTHTHTVCGQNVGFNVYNRWYIQQPMGTEGLYVETMGLNIS
jgi:hypothetical protein